MIFTTTSTTGLLSFKLRKRHALLAVRVVLDEGDVAWFTGDGVPDPYLEVINRKDDTH